MTVQTQAFYDGDGSTTQFSVPFDYIDEAHVKVGIYNPATTLYDEKARDDATYGWSMPNASTVEFDTAPPAPTDPSIPNIKIYRETFSDAPYATFSPGSPIKAVDLNDNFEQSIYVVQEAVFSSATSDQKSEQALNTAVRAETKADQAIVTADAANVKSDEAIQKADAAAAVQIGIVPIYNTPGDDQSGVKNLDSVYPFDARGGVSLPDEFATWEDPGAIRLNTLSQKIEVYNGTNWESAAPGSRITSTPPSPASEGDVWYDPDTGRSYVYYVDPDSSQWVEMNPSWNGSVQDDTVSTTKIVDGAVTNPKLGADVEARLASIEARLTALEGGTP